MMLGIDYASVDAGSKPDWAAAKAAGLRFVIVRGSYSNYADPTLKRDLEGIQAAGLTMGAYMFPLFNENAPTIEAQIAVFQSATRDVYGNYRHTAFPPVLDVEFSKGIVATGRTRERLVYDIEAAVKKLEKAFRITPMIYTSKRVWDGEDADSLNADALGGPAALALTRCPLWLARYPFKTRSEAVGDTTEEKALVDKLPWPPTPTAWGEGNHWIHQYQGDALHFPGFTMTVDLNRFHPMVKGEKGKRVEWVQKKIGIKTGTIGVYDDAMLLEIKMYQRERGLDADGIIGPKTFAEIAQGYSLCLD